MTAAARPYRAAAYTLTVDGVDLSAGVAPRLRSLSLCEKRGKEADQLDLELDDGDGRLALPKRGGKITLAIGWRDASRSTGAQASAVQGLVTKGPFVIDEVSEDFGGAPDLITVRARSADFTGELRTRRERAWTGATVGQVLRQVAAAHGLEPHIAAALDGRVVPVLQQSRESDAALVERLGHLYDAVATIKAGKLIFAPAAAGRSASGGVLAGFTLARSDGDRATYTQAKRDEYDGVSAVWHDTSSATAKTMTAGGSGRVKRLRRKFASAEDAQVAADGENSRLQRAADTMSLAVALGRPDIGPECKGALTGYGKPEVDERTWLVTEATHRISGDGGLTSDFELEAGL